MHAPVRRIAVPFLTVLAGWLAAALPAAACQDPPTNQATIAANVVVTPTIAAPGETVTVTLVVTNFGDPLAPIPVVNNDMGVAVSAEATLARKISEARVCELWNLDTIATMRDDHFLDHVWLDDAYSAHADEPTTWSTSYPITIPEDALLNGADILSVELRAVTAWPFGLVGVDVICIQISDEPSTTPHATFVQGVSAGASGTQVPFEIHVERNGYAPERPLRLVVERENPSDPTDLFPVTPSQLVGEGMEIRGERAQVEMTCGLHFPCFVGMVNALHLKLMDGDFVVWESRITQPDGLAEACVNEAPLAYYELVSVNGGDPGPLTAGEDNTIVVRAYGRNPAVGDPMTDVQLWAGFPPGCEVRDHYLHYHDNPLDSVEPSEGEMTPTDAVIFDYGDIFAIHYPSLDHRFVHFPSGPPVFRDLLEVDLTVHVPSNLLEAGTDFFLPGALIQSRLGGALRTDQANDLLLPVVERGPIILDPPELELPGPRGPNPRPGEPQRASNRR
ncbi:MAG: hypothetical protein AAF533_20640 [Acidobacteriota bacterium]